MTHDNPLVDAARGRDPVTAHTEQPEALRLAELLENKVRGGSHPNHWVFLREGATELRRLHARVQELEKAESDLIAERDRRDEIIDRMADAALGTDRREWSSAYDLEDAAQEVEDKMASKARVPLSDEAEQAAMYRWLRDHYHGFAHYRTDFAKTLGLFERDIKKQMAITQEQKG